MPFWRKDSEEEWRKHEQQAETVQALQSGDIPPTARKRIEEIVKADYRPFTTDFTVREFLLTHHADFQMLGQVTGTSFCSTDYSMYLTVSPSSFWAGEISGIGGAMYESRYLALSRMLEEATVFGATGVIGVRFNQGSHQWGPGMHEFTAFGTAIKVPGWDRRRPFASALSAQEFWQLYQAGYWPVGVGMGICSYAQRISADERARIRPGLGRKSQNCEIQSFTEALYESRRIAMKRMHEEMKREHADGAVGATVDFSCDQLELELSDTVYFYALVNFTTIATMIRSFESTTSPKTNSLICYDLRGKKSYQLSPSQQFHAD